VPLYLREKLIFIKSASVKKSFRKHLLVLRDIFKKNQT
jgi:hypothetical protein